MAKKNKYIDFNSSHRGGRHIRKSVLFAVAVLGVAVVAIAAFAVKAGTSKVMSAVPSSGVSARSAAASTKSKSAEAANSSAQNSSSQPKKTIKTTNRIPVLMYHSINYDPKNPTNILRVPKAKFATEMKWLNDNGYTTLSLDELYSAVSNNKPVAQKSVVLTFDDGYNDNYDNAFPIIKQYKFKATVFMITSKIDDSKNGYLTAAQIKEMDKGGMRIECHTVDHPHLNTLSYKKQYNELSDSKVTLEALLGHSVDFIAYPFGNYNADTIAAAKKIGYKLCFKMEGGTAKISDSPYEFPRTFVGNDLQNFISSAKGTATDSK